MVLNTEKERLLRYPVGSIPHHSELCRIDIRGDYLPEYYVNFNGVTAKIAAVLSMSAEDEKLLRQNLENLGYTDIVTVAFENTDREKIGMCIGSRIKDNLLQVAAVLRGTTGDEWYSNFDVGYSAEHSGFARAADYAELKLGDYIFTHAIGREPDFFITGYSRGGAVANILAKRLCDRYGLERVCAYTFAAPETTISRRVHRYSTLFNLVRDEDFFTRVPLSGWGYTKYGKTLSLSDNGDIADRYKAITGEDYIGFTRQAATDNFLHAVMSLAPNVHAYYERRREVGGQRLSLYEFMRSVADMLSEHMDEAAADVFLGAMVSDYAELISFLSSGADLTELIASAGGVPKCSVADSHSPAAYMAALDVYLTQ